MGWGYQDDISIFVLYGNLIDISDIFNVYMHLRYDIRPNATKYETLGNLHI